MDTVDAYVRDLRRLELEAVRGFLPAPPKLLLEIGAGSGVQARALHEAGFEVSAIDVKEAGAADLPAFPVQVYDGRRIPFPDAHFDVVYSSHTLEHIAPLDDFQREIQRVLKKDGIAVHVMPSDTWRVWTSVAHYLWAAGRVVEIFRKGGARGRTDETVSDGHGEERLLSRVQRMIFPPRHGERGTFLTEAYFFSGRWWRKVFVRQGWSLQAERPLGLFYTGYCFLGPRLGFAARRCWGSLMGSSSRVYVLRPPRTDR
jgi:SAM-dependent methyltransferase